jgi:hypothetical protein
VGIFDKIAEAVAGKKDGGSGAKLSPVDSAVDQSPDEIQLVSHIRQKIDQVRQSASRMSQEAIAFTNDAYLIGHTQVVFDPIARQFKNIDPKRRLKRSDIKINKVLPTVQNRLARLTQSPPKYDVRPNSNSSEDKDCARLGLEILNDVFQKQNFIEKQQDLLMGAMKAGVAYVQVLWDPTLGKPMVDPLTGESGYEGDVRLEVLTLFEVFPDPLARSLDDAQWVIKAKVRKLDYFRDRYAERGAAVKPEDVWLQSSIYDLKSNATTAMGISGAQASEQMKNAAIELVYYEKRSKDHPNGRMVVSASGILLEDKELPIGEFDIVKFDDILVGGKYNSEALITHLRPVQDYYTVLRTKCADWVKQTLGGKYLAAKGAGLSQEAINDTTEVVEYNPVAGASPPTAMNIPQIPQYVYEDIRVVSQDFDLISGINEISRGTTSSSSMPFRLGALLQEQDQTRLGVQTNRNELGYARIGSAILKYVGKNYVMPRLLKVAGDGLGYAVKEFKGADLNDNFDVVVIPGSTSPQSKVLKRQDVINAFQMGLLGDPSDQKLRAKVLKISEFGDVSEVWKDQALDEQQIKKMITAIEDGSFDMKNPGHEWDNHPLFIQELNAYRKTDKFDELSDQQKAQLNYCAEWHVQALISLTQPQIPQQQMMAQHMVNTMHSMTGQHPQPAGGIPATATMPGVGQPPAIGA